MLLQLIALFLIINCRNVSSFQRLASTIASNRRVYVPTRPGVQALRPQCNRRPLFAKSEPNEIIKQDEDVIDKAENRLHIIIPAIVAVIGVAAGAFYFTVGRHGGIDFASLIDKSVEKVAELGPLGYFYFAAIYIAAEILAIPAMPLTASSGFLFGLIPGFLTVLVSATIAATISFFIGKTFLRSWVQSIASGSSKWRAVDKAIEREGFKVVLLLRLSPFLPFAIANYLYGITSVDFGYNLSYT